jgi:signal transduction histidine kinase
MRKLPFIAVIAFSLLIAITLWRGEREARATLALPALAGAAILAWQFHVKQLRHLQSVHQRFSQLLIASQEGERRRIAAEMHDNVGQHLVVIKNLSMMLLKQSGKGQTPQLEDISATASQAIREVREISGNLRPYQLDHVGLTRTIQTLLQRAEAASGIRFIAALDNLSEVLPKDAELNLYRIVQECVTNIIKHSQATEAAVTIRRLGGRLRVTVSDNGKGFRAGATADARGFGLVGIAERAQLLGGQANIHSTRGRGVTTTVEIILRQRGAKIDQLNSNSLSRRSPDRTQWVALDDPIPQSATGRA